MMRPRLDLRLDEIRLQIEEGWQAEVTAKDHLVLARTVPLAYQAIAKFRLRSHARSMSVTARSKSPAT